MNCIKHFVRLFLWSVIFISCAEDEKGVRPKVVQMTESVYASATVQPEDMYDVFAAVSGIIDQMQVQEGDTVYEGQLIAEIRAKGPSINMENAKLIASLARENLRGNSNLLLNVQKEIDTMKEQLRVDSLNYARQKRLWAEKIGSLSELENRQLKYEMTSNNLSNLQTRFEQTKNELKSFYRQSQNSLRNAESSLEDFSIRARLNGRVYAILREEGEVVNQQTPIAQIGKSNSFVIEMLVDEVDIAKLKLGQLTLLTLDAYPGQLFEARLDKIYPFKDNRNQTFMLEAHFIERPAKLFAGLSGEANIVLSQKEKTLTIPLEYLMEGDRVMTKKGEKSVQTGMRNIDVVEVLEGLDTTDVLIKP